MSPLETLQRDIAGRLEADDYFADIGVFVVRPREKESFATIQTRVDQLINCLTKKAGKGGAAVQVLMPLANGDMPNAPGPRLTNVITVRVQEYPLLNMGPGGTQKSAEEIAQRALAVLHLFNPGTNNVLTADPEALTPSDAFDPKVTYDVRLSQKSGIDPLAPVVRPAISAAGALPAATITITCANGGAAIYYTRDGSYPSSLNPAATLYTAPFVQDEAATIRAAAQLAGVLQSNIAQFKVT